MGERKREKERETQRERIMRVVISQGTRVGLPNPLQLTPKPHCPGTQHGDACLHVCPIEFGLALVTLFSVALFPQFGVEMFILCCYILDLCNVLSLGRLFG